MIPPESCVVLNSQCMPVFVLSPMTSRTAIVFHKVKGSNHVCFNFEVDQYDIVIG